MNKRIKGISALLSGLFILFLSCSKDSGSGPKPPEPGEFDKTAMLTHYADNIIIPAYQQMQEDLGGLQQAVNAFADAPSEATQDAAKVAYTKAHLQYEKIEVYNFGPAGAAFLDLYTNFSGGLDYSFTQDGELTGFSVDSVTIENNIASGAYDLTEYSRSSFYAQGFPALSYLMISPGAIEKFSVNTANRVQYVKDVAGRLKFLVDKVVNDWGSYRATFIGNTKTDVGSPIGNLVNQFAYQMDMLKGPRIGWPFGKQSNGIVFETKSEGYYAGIGSQLAQANINSLKNAYTGSGNKKSVAGYLISLGKESLNNDVLAQFDVVAAKLDAIPDPLAESFLTEGNKIEDAYKEIQKLLTLLKTDVPSATGVQITFMDNDGD
ncbi:MAG: imelysin family protein [Chitinophagaceae bacterium]|nr:imelysin family protein [Chitinophagaceae bacterium]